MPVFSGQFKYTLDTKGRVNIPALFRKDLQVELENRSESQDNLFFQITYGKEPCLYIYPRSIFNDFAGKLQEQSDSLFGGEESKVKLFRKVMAKSQPSRCDSQGRIIIPKEHIEHAGIENEVLIIGVGNRIELWNPERFEKSIEDI
ncbi:division/cell wall cluster transcriptional repressor MraZ [candidate division KSB1 bacterium]|nr:division/cell wall cluster transcriptional repressor MraZ [candidate division KSB1 bacterium]